MGIRIVTDSSSDLNVELEKKYNIIVVPLTVNFEDANYKDRDEIKSKEFFEKLSTANKIPYTSQVNPNTFVDVFNTILDNGDEVLGIFLSSELSGTNNSAEVAKNMIKSEKINIIDSRVVSLSLGLLVVKAAEMVEQGKSMNEIVKVLSESKKNMKSIIIVDTLDYLRKGGRLTASKAFIGGILNLKPILTFEDGKLIPKDSVRGRKKALRWVKNWITENDFDLSKKTIYILHASDDHYLQELKKILVKEYNASNIIESEVGAIVGTHCGPGAIGVCFIDD
ncbi:MAG: DegV family protein [Eubacteriaceae bacterium]